MNEWNLYLKRINFRGSTSKAILLKRENTIVVFVSVVSLIRLSALFSSYQKEKYAWVKVSIYAVTLVLDVTKCSKY